VNIYEGWECKNCKFYNDLLTSYCRICNAYKPFWVTDEYQARLEIRRGIFLSYGIYGIIEIEDKENEDKELTKEEELFSKFYNQEKILVKDMDDVMLRDHRNELSQIAFEAKARLIATDDEGRERSSKSSKGKEWLIPADGSQVNTDAIAVVKTRAARMNKIEKLRKQLEEAGLDDETVNEMVKNLERKATEKDVKAITFNKPTVEQSIVMVDVKKEINDEPRAAFDPSSLFGK